MDRLQAQTPGDGNLREHFVTSIEESRRCHEIGERIWSEICTIVECCPNTRLKSLERAFDQFAQATIGSDPDGLLNDTQEKSRRFLRWLVSKSSHKDLTVGEALEDYFREEDHFERQLIGTMVSNYWRMMESHELQLAPVIEVAKLAQLYRGLLYAGVMDTEGSKLDRKMLVDKIADVGKELAGTVIPGLGLATSLAALFMVWNEVDTPALDDASSTNFRDHCFVL